MTCNIINLIKCRSNEFSINKDTHYNNKPTTSLNDNAFCLNKSIVRGKDKDEADTQDENSI